MQIIFSVLSAIISILSITFCIITFSTNRKDKAIQSAKENHQELIEYQLKELKEDVKQILSKMDKYEKDVKDQIDTAIELHIKLYHSKEILL